LNDFEQTDSLLCSILIRTSIARLVPHTVASLGHAPKPLRFKFVASTRLPPPPGSRSCETSRNSTLWSPFRPFEATSKEGEGTRLQPIKCLRSSEVDTRLNATRSRLQLFTNEVQPIRTGQIERAADNRWTGIHPRIHFHLGQQFLVPPRAENRQATFNIADVDAVAGQPEASPDGAARFVLPEVGARCRVQAVQRPSKVTNVQQTIFDDRRPHDTADVA